jgi:hypothetical protein
MSGLFARRFLSDGVNDKEVRVREEGITTIPFLDTVCRCVIGRRMPEAGSILLIRLKRTLSIRST